MGILQILGMNGLLRYRENMLVPIAVIGLILLWAVIVYVVMTVSGIGLEVANTDALVKNLL
jgi:hypothetical protein